MKILICDDKEEGATQTQQAIELATRHQAEVIYGERLTTAIADLFRYARYVLRDPKAPATDAEDEPSWFGQPFDIVILDNNLSELQIEGARHTAESIAGYVRAFARIPYVVSLNKNPHVDFDLRYLVGDYQTQADIALNDAHLSNPGLWTGNPRDAIDGFLPWYWPALNHAPGRRQEQILFVTAHLDLPILRSMEFTPSASDYLSRHASGALSPEAAQVTAVTFLEFFRTACRSLPNLPDREELATAASESEPARAIVSRVVAGEVDRWMRRDLLGPQDVLVDMPHLLMRMPFLLGPHGGKIQCWNDAVMATERPYGLWNEIYERHLHAAEFLHDMWTKGPCFWWRDLKTDTELNRMFYQTETPWVDVVFCEDLSRFMGVSGDEDSTTMEFAAAFEGSWNRRHIVCLPQKQYAPKSRLAK